MEADASGSSSPISRTSKVDIVQRSKLWARATVTPEGRTKKDCGRTGKLSEVARDLYAANVVANDGTTITIVLRMNSKTQHTVSWDQAIFLPPEHPNKESESLDPGVCNLYQYPKIQFLRRGEKEHPGSKSLEPPRFLAGVLLMTLKKALLSLFLDSSNSATECVDSAGAKPIHALLLANTLPAVELATELLTARPRLMLQAHVGQPFEGENVLHILIVNRQEHLVCEMIELAFELFEREELEALFWGQTTGAFFKDEPMRLYGGTLAGYATAFSLEKAITCMLVCSNKFRQRVGKHDGYIELIDPNSQKMACHDTGFLPLHVAVANGLASMYNYWVDLPPLAIEFDHLLAEPQRRSNVGRLPYYARLTALQTAAKLGDHRMVQYIIRCQSIVNWVWGPVTELHLNLEGIDSLGITNNDVMELVANLGASYETRSMLLGSFMQGFIYSLFSQKWKNFGRTIHCVMRIFDLIYLLLLAWLILHMKLSPETADLTLNPVLVIISTIPIWEEDIRVTRKWWRLFRNSSGKKGMLDKHEMRRLVEWMNSHQILTRLFGFAIATPACFILLTADYSNYTETELRQGQQFDQLWVPMAFSLFFHVQNFSRTLLAPSERLGVLYLSVFKMLASDVTDFVLLFGVFLMNYGLAMYISYPRAGTQELKQVSSFNDPVDALNALVTLAFTGDPIILNLDRGELSTLTVAEYIDFVFYVIFYMIYVIMSMILLLNLLIAMMGDTFSNTMSASTLEWRVDFARRLLRLEIQSRAFVKHFHFQLNAGTKIGDSWYYVYRKYEANEEGGGRGKGESMFAADVEAEAEADALDDTKVVGTTEDTTPSQHLEQLASPRAGADTRPMRPRLASRRIGEDSVTEQHQRFKIQERALMREETRKMANALKTGCSGKDYYSNDRRRSRDLPNCAENSTDLEEVSGM